MPDFVCKDGIRNILILLVFISHPIRAQMNIGPNALLTVADNTVFTISASITNQGSILNRGTMNILYNWSNNGLYEFDDDTIRFAGEQLQTVDNNGGSTGSIVMEGEGVVLTTDISITNNLILNSGYIWPEPSSRLILYENLSVINASASSHVKGRVISVGAGEKFYPIGSENYYMPAWLEIPEGNSVMAGLEAIEPNPVMEGVTGISRVFPEAFWQLNVYNGDIPDTRLSLSYSSFYTGDPNLLVVAELSETGNTFRSLGNHGVDVQQSTVTSREAISGDVFALAEVDGLITICNIISPNGDHINDYLHIANIEQFPDNEIFVFDRTGKQIYQEKSYHNTWQGSIDHKPLPAGNYYCVVRLSGHNLTYSQAITIIR